MSTVDTQLLDELGNFETRMGSTRRPIKLSKRDVRDRVGDWIVRLERLYKQLDQWVEDIPDVKVQRHAMQQLIEPLMERFKIAPRNVPAYTIFLKKNRVAFIPSSLWIIGANGRINVAPNARQHSLVDLGGQGGAPSRWHLVGDNLDKPLIPLTKKTFLNLLAGRK